MIDVAHHRFGEPLSVLGMLLGLDARDVGEQVQKRLLALPLHSPREHLVDRFIDLDLLVLSFLLDSLL